MFNPEELEGFFTQHAPAPSKESLIATSENARELKEIMQALSISPAFIEYQKRIQQQITSRLAENLQIPTGLDAVTRILYCNGEIAGLKLAHDFVNILIESCNDTLKINGQMISAHYPDEQEQEDGQE